MDDIQILKRICTLNQENKQSLADYLSFLEKKESDSLIDDETKAINIINAGGVLSFIDLAKLIKTLPIEKTTWGYFMRGAIDSWVKAYFKCSLEEAILIIDILIKYHYLQLSSEGNVK
jgi:hypothetical protein